MTDTLAAIVAREPDWNALPADARRIAGRCCDVASRRIRRRLQSIGEARIALESPELPSGPVLPGAGINRGVAALLILGGLTAGALGAWTLMRGRGPSKPGSEARLSLPIGPADSLAGAFVLSDDGSKLAFVGQQAGKNYIFLRPLAEDDAKLVPGTEGAALAGPTFSPDGRWLAFGATGTLKKVPLDGGPAIILAESAAGTSSRPAWGTDDTIVFSNPTRGLSRISAAGGQPQAVSTPDSKRAEIVHEMPWLLPDRKTLLFSVRLGTTAGSTTVVALTLATGERRELFPGVDSAWSETIS